MTGNLSIVIICMLNMIIYMQFLVKYMHKTTIHVIVYMKN